MHRVVTRLLLGRRPAVLADIRQRAAYPPLESTRPALTWVRFQRLRHGEVRHPRRPEAGDWGRVMRQCIITWDSVDHGNPRNGSPLHPPRLRLSVRYTHRSLLHTIERPQVGASHHQHDLYAQPVNPSSRRLQGSAVAAAGAQAADRAVGSARRPSGCSGPACHPQRRSRPGWGATRWRSAPDDRAATARRSAAAAGAGGCAGRGGHDPRDVAGTPDAPAYVPQHGSAVAQPWAGCSADPFGTAVRCAIRSGDSGGETPSTTLHRLWGGAP